MDNIRLDDDHLWAFVDGDLSEAEEEAILHRAREDAGVAGKLLAILQARREVAAEKSWDIPRIMALINSRLKSEARTSAAQSSATDLIRESIRIGKHAMTILFAGLERQRWAPTPALATVRGDSAKAIAPTAAASTLVQWSGQLEEGLLILTVEASSSPGIAGFLAAEMRQKMRTSEREIELKDENERLLEAISLDALPARFELPFGRAQVTLSAAPGGVSTKLMEWDIPEKDRAHD
ncbi:MAG: hypothetical protein NTX50_05900 [Candidatus Sumerlaeota bacterium]|nr:hypothetical protein [Candidatus Sumerlaeota bacterium]